MLIIFKIAVAWILSYFVSERPENTSCRVDSNKIAIRRVWERLTFCALKKKSKVCDSENKLTYLSISGEKTTMLCTVYLNCFRF